MMNIQAAKDQIKDTVQAYLEKDDAGMYVINPARQRPIFLVGAPGIGKTAIIEQIAQELEIGVVSYSMTHHTRQSALGLPRIVHRNFEGFEYEASEYTMSEIVSAVYDYMESSDITTGILFLDEINCVSETLYPSMLQFLQFKTFGRHRIPPDWIIVCAGNPPEYNKAVHEFDIVTLDRMREIDIQPDYSAWKRYATEKGIHPVVTTFLEAKPDCFYNVESKPGGGKSFVTARGWEDLGEVIALYERMGKPCNRELFSQFLRDDDIADRFAVYYTLFDKYRSDYQVARILDGQADKAIFDRAKTAEFDERVALLGLLLDALSTSCRAALDQENVVVEVRDELRRAKPDLLEGATVEDALVGPLHARKAALERKAAAGVAKPSFVRSENLAINMMKDLVAACELQQKTQGSDAFEVINAAYRSQVEQIEPLAKDASRKLDNAFDFIERSFGNGREMLVFMAELTTRQDTTQFIARYGNDRYYAHNDELQVDMTRRDLSERVRALGDLDFSEAAEHEDAYAQAAEGRVLADSLTVDMGGAAGLSVKGAPMPAAASASDGADATDEQLAAYYTSDFEFGFASMSRMTLPSLDGMRVLDVCCRRGKGAYKISARVGDEGFVMGVDPSPDYIREALSGIEGAWRKNHLKRSNMDFAVAYPENLMGAGLGDGSFDAVYINSVSTLLCNAGQAIREFYRVLKPGGLLIFESVVASAPRDEAVVQAARAMGNSVQAALPQEHLFELFAQAGFEAPQTVEEREVSPDQGFLPGRTVEIAPSDEDVSFTAVAYNLRKPL